MDTWTEVSMGRASSPNRAKEQGRLGGGSKDLARDVEHLSALDAGTLRQ